LSFADPHDYQAQIRPARVVLVTSAGAFQTGPKQIQLPHLWTQSGWQTLPVLARAQLEEQQSQPLDRVGHTSPYERP